jgi:hypothetical protein
MGECFQLRGQPITIAYDIAHDTKEGKQDAAVDAVVDAAKYGRVHIDSQMVEWSVMSTSKEMASFMLLKKPLFMAMSMNMSISLHWKCQANSFAHHITQASCPSPPLLRPHPSSFPASSRHDILEGITCDHMHLFYCPVKCTYSLMIDAERSSLDACGANSLICIQTAPLRLISYLPYLILRTSSHKKSLAALLRTARRIKYTAWAASNMTLFNISSH